ncbi:MAG TPA: hypothetical protein VML55_21275 [Planctomycetaceae bacterium]|nr:hypothetical protein [Planctomycetaceae bacterium]
MADSFAVPQNSGEGVGREPQGTDRRKPADLLDEIKQLTQRHFPEGPVEVELDYDPEVPSDEFFVLSVTASGSARQIVERERQWHREVHELARDRFDAFRISVRDIV